MIFLATIKAKVIAALGGIIALGVIIIGAFYKGRKSKATEVQAETAKTIIETVKEVRKNEERINNLSDSDLDKQLFRDARHTGRMPMDNKD